MSQATTWGVQSAGPATMAQYAVRDNAAFDALLSAHRGASRPAYAVASTIWVKAGTAPVTDAEIYYFDGTNDILIGTINESTNVITFAGLGTAAGLDVGTDENDVVQLGAGGALPAVDGSLLTGITPGGRILLSSGSVAAAATLELTTGIDSTYDAYELVLSGFRPVTDNVGLRIRVSDDGGSTFEAGASDYRYGIRFVGNTTAAGVIQSAGTTAFAVFGDTGNAVTESVNGRIVFYEPASTAFHKCFDWAGVNNGALPETYAVFGAGQFIGNTNAINALQIYFSSGNIAEGNYALYGMRN